MNSELAKNLYPRRDPADVMRIDRLGSLHQSRLSFMRILMRRMAKEQWTFDRKNFEVDTQGVGHAVYSARTAKRTYSLVAFAHDLPSSERSDRVIAEAWDTTFCLFDGVPTNEDLQRLQINVPLQEAGRLSDTEICLSRANRSVRLWAHFVDSLAQGKQPRSQLIDEVGYLMRTTSVYGSGKFGASDRESIAQRAEMQSPFQAELLSVYLIRWFVKDLVQHMATVQGGETAVSLDEDIARRLGIGNSTGLGMAPFIINHPLLFNNWISAREEAIARVRSVRNPTNAEIKVFTDTLQRSILSVSRWHSEHEIQQLKLSDLRNDLKTLVEHLSQVSLQAEFLWNALIDWSKKALSVEGQELLLSLLLEPYEHLVDELSLHMSDSNPLAFNIDGAMTVKETLELIEQSFDWALDVDWNKAEHCARIWYVSEEKLEPRLGNRDEESLADYEQALAPARDAAAAYKALKLWKATNKIATFLLSHPEHRHSIRRAQISKQAPYSEIRGNTIGENIKPIDLLRAKLSFFGATHFDPRSDRWVRICMYAGAPYPEALNKSNADDWVYPGLVT